MDSISKDRLIRGIAGIIAGVLLVWAYQAGTSKFHSECTQYSGGRDSECVGDSVRVKGPDYGGAFLLLVFAGIAASYAVSEHEE